MIEIRAPITGSVWQVVVSEGDTIRSGDTVAIIESMKLEIRVDAPEEGTISRVLVAAGDAVDEGDVMFVCG